MRALSLVALFSLAACSWDAEKPNIFVQVDGIPPGADHLDVTLTSSDSSVQPLIYRPSFQPDPTQPSRTVQLSFSAPTATGTFTLTIVAADRSCPSVCTNGLAAGSTPATGEPAAGSQVNLQVTLH